MAYIYAKHEIEDYDTWERHHEDNAEARAAHGSLGTQAFQPADGEDTVIVLQEVADDRLDEALAYYDSEAFAETLEEAGVVSVAASAVLEKVHEGDARGQPASVLSCCAGGRSPVLVGHVDEVDDALRHAVGGDDLAVGVR